MTTQTTLQIGALSFDDASQAITFPISVINPVLGSNSASPQIIKYSDMGTLLGDSEWVSTAPYSSIKSVIINYIQSQIGAIVVQ